MKKFNRFNKLGLRLGLFATIVTACNLGTAYSPTTQSAPTSSGPGTDTTGTVETMATQESTSRPSLITTITSTSIVSLHPSNTVTTQPNNVPFNPLPTELNHTPERSPVSVVWEMLGQVSKDRALVDLRKLTGEEPICTDRGCYTIDNRLTGSEGLQWAKDYIYEELVSLGYSVEVRDWSHSGYADQNIIARKPGLISPGEEIYFIAHVDGKGDEGDRYPAADDDASGVVDILELARVLSNYTFSRTVVLFFSTGEEESRLGVKSYLGQLAPNELNTIKYAVDIDMVGYDGNHDKGMELWYGGQSSSLALTQIISETIKAYRIGLEPTFIVGCG